MQMVCPKVVNILHHTLNRNAGVLRSEQRHTGVTKGRHGRAKENEARHLFSLANIAQQHKMPSYTLNAAYFTCWSDTLLA